MRRNDLISGSFFLGVGLLFTLYSRSVDIGEWREPGAGFLPFWAGAVLIGMSVLLLVKTLVKHARETEAFFPEQDSWKRVSAIVLALILYNLLLKPLGFTLVTFFFVFVLVKYVFPQGWLMSIITAAVSALGARLLFVNLLGLQLPKGLLG